MRTCVACGARRSKWELARIARSSDGEVRIDRAGTGPGRGAYLCPEPRCWREGLKRRKMARMEHTLRGPISETARAALLEFGESIERHGPGAGGAS